MSGSFGKIKSLHSLLVTGYGFILGKGRLLKKTWQERERENGSQVTFLNVEPSSLFVTHL